MASEKRKCKRGTNLARKQRSRCSSRKERSFDKKREQRHRNERNKDLVRSYEEVDVNNIMLSDSHQENPGNEK